MIRITGKISINEDLITEQFVRSSGPGGQNVNKVSTAAQLRFNAGACEALDAEFLERLAKIAGKRMTTDGEIIIDARRYRTQEKNRQDARERLIALLKEAAVRPTKRKKTKPTRASKERRLETKRHRSDIKRLRQSRPSDA